METVGKTSEIVEGGGDETHVFLLVKVEGVEDGLEALFLARLDEEVDVLYLLHHGARVHVYFAGPLGVDEGDNTAEKNAIFEDVIERG